jgi:hypothetical protein
MQRQDPDPRHRRSQPPRWIALVVVLVIGVAVFLLLTGGGPAKQLRDAITGEEPVPEFAFEMRRTSAFEVTPEHHRQLDSAAADVAADIDEQIDLLYTAAFLDPNNWKGGDYGDAWAVFDERAAAAAQEQAEVLTLGASAGDTYQKVAPDASKLTVKVLFDAEGNPASAVAIVRFRALATAKGGAPATAIISEGQYILQDTDDGWRIVSFDVDRGDRDAAVPTASGSASPEAS